MMGDGYVNWEIHRKRHEIYNISGTSDYTDAEECLGPSVYLTVKTASAHAANNGEMVH